MKNLVVLMVIAVAITGALFLSGNLPSCAFDSGPDQPGTFKGTRGWELLKSVPEPVWSSADNFLLSPLGEGFSALYAPNDWAGAVNVMPSSFAVRVYSAGRDLQNFSFGVPSQCLDPVSEFEVPSGAFGWYYPKEIEGKILLKASTDATRMIFPSTSTQNFGSREVSVYKFNDVPPGKWRLSTTTGLYFIEIR